MRWHVLIILSLVVGTLQMFRLPVIAFNGDNISFELLFLIAYHTALHSPESYALPGFWWCGFTYDLLISPRMGVNTILFSVAAFLTLVVRRQTIKRHVSTRVVMVVILVLAIHILRPLLNAGGTPFLALHWWREKLLSAFCTGLASPIAGFLIEYTPLRTWREDEPSFGLSGA